MRRALAREDEAQRLLGAGLADRAGDGDDPASRAPARPRARAGAWPRARPARRRAARTRERAARSAATTAAAAPLASAAGTKSWPSRASPLMAKNRSPGSRVRVSIEAPVAWREAAADAARRWRPRSRLASKGARSSLPLRDGRPDLLVVRERQRPVADDLAGFMALAGHDQDVAGAKLPHGRADRLAPGRRSRARRARRPGSRRGSRRDPRERGLSSVTIATSAFSTAMRPISGRLPRSRSPPQPNDADEPARAKGRSASSTWASASGLWA